MKVIKVLLCISIPVLSVLSIMFQKDITVVEIAMCVWIIICCTAIIVDNMVKDKEEGLRYASKITKHS